MLHPLKVAELMTRRVCCLRVDTPVREAMDMLVQKRISGAPVVDDRAHVLGVLSQVDCLRFLYDELLFDAPDAPVERLMTREVECVSPELSLLQLAERFLTVPYRRFPVIEQGALVGIVTRHDALVAVRRLAWDAQTAGGRQSEHARLVQKGRLANEAEHLVEAQGPALNRWFG
jgi:CBS domain-containing protein